MRHKYLLFLIISFLSFSISGQDTLKNKGLLTEQEMDSLIDQVNKFLDELVDLEMMDKAIEVRRKAINQNTKNKFKQIQKTGYPLEYSTYTKLDFDHFWARALTGNWRYTADGKQRDLSVETAFFAVDLEFLFDTLSSRQEYEVKAYARPNTRTRKMLESLGKGHYVQGLSDSLQNRFFKNLVYSSPSEAPVGQAVDWLYDYLNQIDLDLIRELAARTKGLKELHHKKNIKAYAQKLDELITHNQKQRRGNTEQFHYLWDEHKRLFSSEKQDLYNQYYFHANGLSGENIYTLVYHTNYVLLSDDLKEFAKQVTAQSKLANEEQVHLLIACHYSERSAGVDFEQGQEGKGPQPLIRIHTTDEEAPFELTMVGEHVVSGSPDRFIGEQDLQEYYINTSLAQEDYQQTTCEKGYTLILESERFDLIEKMEICSESIGDQVVYEELNEGLPLGEQSKSSFGFFSPSGFALYPLHEIKVDRFEALGGVGQFYVFDLDKTYTGLVPKGTSGFSRYVDATRLSELKADDGVITHTELIAGENQIHIYSDYRFAKVGETMRSVSVSLAENAVVPCHKSLVEWPLQMSFQQPEIQSTLKADELWGNKVQITIPTYAKQIQPVETDPIDCRLDQLAVKNGFGWWYYKAVRSSLYSDSDKLTAIEIGEEYDLLTLTLVEDYYQQEVESKMDMPLKQFLQTSWKNTRTMSAERYLQELRAHRLKFEKLLGNLKGAATQDEIVALLYFENNAVLSTLPIELRVKSLRVLSTENMLGWLDNEEGLTLRLLRTCPAEEQVQLHDELTQVKEGGATLLSILDDHFSDVVGVKGGNYYEFVKELMIQSLAHYLTKQRCDRLLPDFRDPGHVLYVGGKPGLSDERKEYFQVGFNSKGDRIEIDYRLMAVQTMFIDPGGVMELEKEIYRMPRQSLDPLRDFVMINPFIKSGLPFKIAPALVMHYWHAEQHNEAVREMIMLAVDGVTIATGLSTVINGAKGIRFIVAAIEVASSGVNLSSKMLQEMGVLDKDNAFVKGMQTFLTLAELTSFGVLELPELALKMQQAGSRTIAAGRRMLDSGKEIPLEVRKMIEETEQKIMRFFQQSGIKQLDADVLADFEKLVQSSQRYQTFLKRLSDLNIPSLERKLNELTDQELLAFLDDFEEASSEVLEAFVENAGLVDAWRVLIGHSKLRKQIENLEILINTQSRFTFEGLKGLEAFSKMFGGNDNVQKFIENMQTFDKVGRSVPGILYSGTKQNALVRVMDNEAIPITYNKIVDGQSGEVTYKATCKKKYNLIDKSDKTLYTEQFFGSFELEFSGLIISMQNFRQGAMNREKIAIIGRSMGGGKRLNPDTETFEFAYGVTDYALKIRALGFETRLFIQTKFDDLPYLTKEAVNEIATYRNRIAQEMGVDAKLVELDDDIIVETLAYKQDVEWSNALVNQGYSVINIGNPNGILKKSEFYNIEVEIIFGK